jgi:hypothetical protein
MPNRSIRRDHDIMTTNLVKISTPTSTLQQSPFHLSSHYLHSLPTGFSPSCLSSHYSQNSSIQACHVIHLLKNPRWLHNGLEEQEWNEK